MFRGSPSARGTFWLGLLGLVLCVGLPELQLGQRLAPGHSVGASLAREAVWWGLGGLMLGYVVFVERRELSSIGLRRPGWTSVVWGLVATLALLLSLGFSYGVVFPLLHLGVNQQALHRITDLPRWLRVLLVLRAGVVEEILYRGYLIERVAELIGSRRAAAGVSVVVFTWVHLSGWGAAQLIVVAFGAVIFAGLYLWRRDLVCNMIAHVLADAVAFVAA